MEEITWLRSGACSRAQFRCVRALEAASDTGSTQEIVDRVLEEAKRSLSPQGGTMDAGSALLLVLYCQTVYSPFVGGTERLTFCTMPMLQALSQPKSARDAVVAWSMLEHLSEGVHYTSESDSLIPPVLLRNTVREQIVQVVQEKALCDAVLQSLAKGIPHGYELLPAISTPLLHLSYHDKASVRKKSLQAMYYGMLSEWDAMHAVEDESRPDCELAPVLLERVHEMLDTSRRRRAPETDAGVLRTIVRILRWVSERQPALLGRSRMTELLQPLCRADAPYLRLAAIEACRSVIRDLDKDDLEPLEATLVDVYARHGLTSSTLAYATGLECARTLGQLWLRIPPRDTPERAPQESAILAFVRAQLPQPNSNIRHYTLSVLQAWIPLDWMHAPSAGSTFSTFGLTERETQILFSYARDADPLLPTGLAALCAAAMAPRDSPPDATPPRAESSAGGE